MDWLDSSLEETFYLKLGESFKVSTLEEMIERLRQGKLRLSTHGSGVIIDLFARYYKLGGKHKPAVQLTDKDLKVLNCFLTLLELEVKWSVVITERGPTAFKDAFPVAAYLLQGKEEFVGAGINLVKALMEICLGFADWRTFVASDVAGQVAATIASKLVKVEVATQALTEHRLAIRKEISLANEIIGKVSPSGQMLEGDLDRASVLSNIGNIFDVILGWGQEQQKEVLDKGEKLALVSVQSALRELRRILEEDYDRVPQAHRVLVAAQANLVKIQKGRRARKANRFQERLIYLEEICAKPADEERREILSQYKANLGIQQRAIEALEQVYESMANASVLYDVSNELQFLDQQIAQLYDVSISVVVAGVVKVGKSTILNCITGENLSPHRGTTMTAIPTRFVHDPNATQPVMLVPFAEELNTVVLRLKEWVDREGLEYFQGLLKLDHCHLLQEIQQGLTFTSRYEGTQTILKVSTFIHDLFRLAVNDLFEGMLAAELPLDWNQGLDSYLTVYLRFPNAEMLTGLVNFSVVDTPGIDESEVRKLNLHNTVRSALTSSNFGVVVCPCDGTVHGISYQGLKEMTKSIRQRFQTPMMVMATRSELQPQGQQLESRKQDICMALSFDTNETFVPGEVFLVSGLKMFVGSRILQLLEQTNEKPSVDHSDPWIRELVREFAMIAGNSTDTYEERLDWYRDLSQESLTKKVKSLVASSQMPNAINHLIKTTVVQGIPIIIQTTFNKVRELVTTFLQQFEHNVNVGNLAQAQYQCKQEWRNLSGVVEQFKAGLAEKRAHFREEIRRYSEEAKADLLTHFQPKPLDPKASIDSLCGIINNLLGAISDEKIKALVRGTATVKFATDKEAQQAIMTLNSYFKKGIEEYLQQPSVQLPDELQRWTRQKQQAVQGQIARIRSLFTAQLGLHLPHLKTVSMDELFRDEISMAVVFKAQQVVESNNRFATLFSRISRFLRLPHNLSPEVVRRHLTEQALVTIDSTTEILYAHLDRVFRELNKVFLEEIASEVHYVNDAADAKLWEIAMLVVIVNGIGRNDPLVNRDQLLGDLSRSLQALDNLV